MPLYRMNQDRTVSQIVQSSFSKERDPQKTIQANMEALLGVRFILNKIMFLIEQSYRQTI